ncbi:tyrosine-protein phosphatase non-receptor type 20 isoform X2 [Diceros bicornis minor]|uniref:tyrosine-protein phosphatase non-receptor type 20 isoform X2 n=1 Tax=Diceros bicornis minor TaxID=77932 RepID=UPI0026EB3860|nr:tyrosine-protein phosphatase non-receptor type 20 isoform X2 [Diceros bicornis minor]
MSSPRKAAADSRKDQKGDDSDTKDLNFWETSPSSSEEKTLRPVFENEISSEKVKLPLQNFQHSAYEDLFKEAEESDSEPITWSVRNSFLRDRWSSEEEEPAGPSQTVSPQLHGIQIVSERELAQLAQVRPLIFSFHEQSAIKDCFKMLEKKRADYEIIQEFMALEYKNLPGEFTSGNEPRNRDKNRYRDVLPYDSTRVPLGENKDYINASYIRIVNSGEEYFYIATQGPLPATTDDFWEMVLENNSNVIVMITRETEGGIIKCHHYWPISMKKPLELKSCHIFLENYQILQYFIIRIFQVVRKSTGTRHSVKHLQFTDWPDHGTPASVDAFIKYIRYVRKSHLTGPLVVHCSAGVGRTGVFLCVDVVFCAIEKNFSFSISDIVAQMREQRYGMIQTKEQYCFCYKIVLEVLQKLLTFH